MKCSDIMTRRVFWLLPSDTIHDAAQLMAFEGVGFVPICNEQGQAIGVLTDRDVAIRAASRDERPSDMKVEDVMTREVVSSPADAPLSRAEEAMAKARVSRILILESPSAKLVGVISMADLAQHEGSRRTANTLRAVTARETPDRRDGAPSHASQPEPVYFHGDRAPYQEHGIPQSRAARDRRDFLAGRWTLH